MGNVRFNNLIITSCAGLILLADTVDGSNNIQFDSIKGLNVKVTRNAFGTQLDSFSRMCEFEGIKGGMIEAVCIRYLKVG